MESLTVDASNIESLVRSLKKKMSVPGPDFVVFPLVLSNRYRGKGRPRKIDYNYYNMDFGPYTT